MSLWVAVHALVDNTDVVAATFNQPLLELTERTNYLYDKVQDLYGTGLFESIRLMDVTLATDVQAGDIVYRNPDTGIFERAIASMSLADNFSVADSSYALGIAVSAAAYVGTVVVSGRAYLTTGQVPWVLADLMQTGETFRAGPYYLSSLEAGKITAYPLGPRIYIGNYSDTDVLISPQYRDTGEAHQHRTYPLFSQPAGTQLVTNPEQADGTHAILGFDAQVAAEAYDRVPKLVATGDWTGLTAQYAITLGGLTITDLPSSFAVATLYWSGAESGSVRVTAFEQPVSIGTKGLKVSLENPTTDSWDIPYAATSDSQGKRTWDLDIPEMTQGWLARHYRQEATTDNYVDNGYRFRLMGGPAAYADLRVNDQITLVCPGAIVAADMTVQPAAHETTIIGSYVFEYTDDGTYTAGNIPVTIELTAAETLLNLQAAILDTADTSIVPVQAADASDLFIGTTVATAVTHLGSVLTPVTTAHPIGQDAKLLIYDRDNMALVAAGYWDAIAWYTPVTLTNGLQLIAVPYTATGTPCASENLDEGNAWRLSITDEAPGAHFVYAMGMHQSLNQFFPPVPRNSAAFVLNGVELDSKDLFPTNPTYGIGTEALYWYSNTYGMVPWPADWVSIISTGAQHLQQNAAFHFIRNAGQSGVVTSLRAATGSPIVVRRCGTVDTASVGDLELDVDFNLQSSDANLAGFQVVKSTASGKLLRGPVVERIVPGPGIALTQTSGAAAGQGTVTIGLANAPDYMGDFEQVALQNAKEEVVGMFPYIRMLPWTNAIAAQNIPSGFIANFRVPFTLPPTSRYKFCFYISMFGEDAVAATPLQTAGLLFSYSILTDYTDILSGDSYQSLKDAFVSTTKQIDVRFGGGSPFEPYTGYDPLMIHNDSSPEMYEDIVNKRQYVGFSSLPGSEFAAGCVRAGSLIGIKLQRTATLGSNPYTGGLGFLTLRWKLVAL